MPHALGLAIRAMGVKEFAAKARMASPNVSDRPAAQSHDGDAQSPVEAVWGAGEPGPDGWAVA